MSFKVEVWGDYACFTRPEMKAERVSYEIMTPSAARGILESIYWHPGLQYHIDKIHILKPIQFTSIRRNEVKNIVSASNALSAFKSGKTFVSYAGEDRLQRASLILRDVHYVIDAHFSMTARAGSNDTPEKFCAIIDRRLTHGQCFNQPYFGCREFPVHFCKWEEGHIPALPLTQDLGFMLYDMDYTNLENIKPKFFRAKLVNGVLDTSDCEVFR